MSQALAFGLEEVIQSRVRREWAIFVLMGQRSLLMQVAHPLVAAAVREHSDYRRKPLQRLAHTFDLSMKLFTGTEAEAREAAKVINGVHRHVKGSDYDARDPALGKWVWSSLVDGSLVGHELFVGPLTSGEKQAIFDTYCSRVALIGVAADLPDTVEGVRQYVDQMIDSGAVHAGPAAREIARAILGPSLPGLYPLTSYLARATLPESLREQYGLRWSLGSEIVFTLGICQVANRVLSRLTGDLRCLEIGELETGEL